MEKIVDNYINIFEYTTEINLDVDEVKSIRIEIENNMNNITIDLGYRKLFKIYHLLSLARYRTKMPKESIESELKALEYAEALKDKYYMARAHSLIAINNIMVKNSDEFKKHYVIAEKIYKDLNKYDDLVQLDSRVAVHMFRNGGEESIIRTHLEKCLNNLDKFQSELSAQLYITVASVYSVIYGEFEVAIDLYIKALDIAKYYNDTSKEILILYYIAIGYSEIRMKDEAIEVFDSILKDKRFLKFTAARISTLCDFIKLLLEDNINLNYVEELLEECEEEIKKVDFIKQEQYKMQLNLLRVQYNNQIGKGKIEDNLYILDKSKEFYEKHKDECIIVYIDYQIENLYGDVYYKIGEFLKAVEHHKAAISIAKKYRPKYAIQAYESLAKDYEALEDYKSAYEAINEFKNLVMNVENLNLVTKYNNIQKNYEELKWIEREREEFFANLSHELKTPINIIYSSIQLMNLFKDKSDKSFKEYYLKHEKSVRINCLRMLKIVQNMIDMNKIDCGAIQPNFNNYNLVSLIEEVTMSVLSSVEVKNINIIFDTEEEEMIVKCDPYMIERIILNLLSNAIKFSKEDGNVYVMINKKNKHIEISVSDDGIGIPNNMKENIFNKFVQVDRGFNRKNEGSGIGLSLVKSLVGIHNGDIEVESVEGIGSKFKIFIPDVRTTQTEKVDKYDIDIDRVFSELSDIYEL